MVTQHNRVVTPMRTPRRATVIASSLVQGATGHHTRGVDIVAVERLADRDPVATCWVIPALAIPGRLRARAKPSCVTPRTFSGHVDPICR
jgi:hypothetical protein